MQLWQLITGCFTGAIAILIGVYVSFTAMKKGPIFSNGYIWLTDKEKENADKPHQYRLVTVIFSGLFAFFALETVYIFTMSSTVLILAFIPLVFDMIYAIVDYAKSGRNNK